MPIEAFGKMTYVKLARNQEDESHIFRNCVNSKLIWQKVRLGFLENMSGLEFIDWLDENLKNKGSNAEEGLQWCITFGAIIWNIWKARNDFQFNDNAINCDQVTIKS